MSIKIGPRTYKFRRLTWVDELRLHEAVTADPGMSQLAFALVAVDDKEVRAADAKRIVGSIPRPVRERLTLLYLGQLPPNRMIEVKIPAPAPEPRVIQAAIDEEEGEADRVAEDLLERRFGRDEVEAAEAQAQAIARAGSPGIVPSLSSGDPEDDETTLPSPGRFMAVM